LKYVAACFIFQKHYIKVAHVIRQHDKLARVNLICGQFL
jgi:hypothetical protein